MTVYFQFQGNKYYEESTTTTTYQRFPITNQSSKNYTPGNVYKKRTWIETGLRIVLAAASLYLGAIALLTIPHTFVVASRPPKPTPNIPYRIDERTADIFSTMLFGLLMGGGCLFLGHYVWTKFPPYTDVTNTKKAEFALAFDRY